MNPKQVKSIKDTFSDLIDEIAVKVNGISFRERTQDNFKKLSDKLNPQNKASTSLDEQTATWVFVDAVTLFNLKKNLSVPFFENIQLDEEAKAELIDYLFDYFMALPHEYKISIPLHNLNIPLFKGENNNIEVLNLGVGFLHDESPFNALTNRYLRLKGNGYLTYRNGTHGFKPYLQDFNVFLYCFTTANIFTVKSDLLINRYSFEDTLPGRTKKIPILHAKIKNTSREQILDTFELPLQLSKFLDDLKFNKDKEYLSIEKLRFINSLINDNSDAAKYIKAAMDWYMNSKMAMDETMSFIQICMGIEALLGDKREQGAGITQTLSDRCSYLIGKGMDDRNEIKKQLKKIYELRSAIVHGLKNRINASEEEYVNNAALFLRRAIKVECQYLEYYNE
ncbi:MULTISPECIES: HEPN domain-containing protein [Klebsiella]|uniref:HEPN domain-containing protein n=1 Tax=Klebsiella TaxID=570 RepID=UPI0021F7BF04|nr:HEPN domain-containing protein [Klebsiella pneumoniae]MCW0274074.1 HEPN domain-containing protein [Klebsiella pneumoniae]